MKKRLTELMDDVPEEMVMEILERGTREKRSRKKIWLKAAAAAVVLLAGGGIAYGAVNYPEFFSEYMGGDNGHLAGRLTADRESPNSVYESESRDYRMKVEEILTDHTYIKILLSVEGLNKAAARMIEKSTVCPTFNSGNYQITFEKETDKGKKYYLIEAPYRKDQYIISYHPLLDRSNISEEWLKKHREEIVTVEFTAQSKTGESIAISPGAIEEGVEYHSLTVSYMGVKGEASVSVTGDLPVPRVTAVMADGQKICLVEGNMGVDGEDELLLPGDESVGGGFEGGGKWKRGELKLEKQFKNFLDLENVDQILINGKEVWNR